MWRCIKCILLYCRASDIIRICVHSVSFLAGIDICGKEAGRWCHPWVFTLERCWGRVHSRRKRYSSFFTISHSDSQLFTLHDFMTFSVWKVMRIIWCECSSVISEWDRSYSQCCKWFFLNNLEVVTPTGCCHFVVGIILTLVNGVLQLILLRSDSWVWVVNWVQYTMEIVWMFFSGLDLRQHWYVLWSDLLVSFCVCLFHNFVSSWFPFVNMVRTKKFIITSKSTKTGHRCSLVVTLLWILCAGNYHSISCVIVPAMYIM